MSIYRVPPCMKNQEWRLVDRGHHKVIQSRHDHEDQYVLTSQEGIQAAGADIMVRKDMRFNFQEFTIKRIVH